MTDPELDDEEEDLLTLIIESGLEVAYQDWDSGGPGAGAGRVSVYQYLTSFYLSHDAGLEGPFATLEEALIGSGIESIGDATVQIWRADRGVVYRRKS